MIETPRAALLSDEIAEVAEFFSFGTNDLTQMTLGLSRDDAGKFLPDYVDESKAGIFGVDPFQSIDQKGVGMLIRSSIEKGRMVRPKLKIGICGEHGGDSVSVKFCCRVGMDYVSASPFRVPVARLAAAQAAIEDEEVIRSKTKPVTRGKTARKSGSRTSTTKQMPENKTTGQGQGSSKISEKKSNSKNNKAKMIK